MLTNVKGENIVYNQWKRFKVDIRGNVKEKTRLVQTEVPAEEFRGIFMDEMTAFREHIEHIKIQYKAMKNLKVQLLPTQCIIQMDFAKDYTAKIMTKFKMPTLVPVMSPSFQQWYITGMQSQQNYWSKA